MNFLKSRSKSRRTSIYVNSEKWKNYNKKISRPYLNSEIDSEEEATTLSDIVDWEEYIGYKSDKNQDSDEDVEINLNTKQTLILSTLVPDELLLTEKLDCVDPKRFIGVLLMADVSGYTPLSEHYCNSGKGGIYRLTVTLNTYIGSLTEIIYSHGGDIIKFAGDAFLAVWKTDKRSFIGHTIHKVIACALVIQHNYAFYETDAKIHLKVKLAISAGTIYFTPIGRGLDMNYIMLGQPVVEAKLAESTCMSGEVKLAPTAWGHLYSRNYDHILHPDGHVTVTNILYDPHEKDLYKPYAGIVTYAQIKKTFTTIESLPDYIWDNSNLKQSDIMKNNETLNIRPNVIHGAEREIGSDLRNYMIRPLSTQIDAHQPLEYLTEMRHVSVVLITLKPRVCPYNQLVTIINNAYIITCDIVYKSMGCVNKIILFDKDVMILVIFGLRGFKHESEAQAALKCAYSIRKSISALDGILEISIGVTTGQMYCGVIGHPLRREFTVIGSVVNKAARLMCSFRDKVTCDEETFIKSKMSPNSFILQPKRKLKGITDAGKIFEYTEEIRLKELYDIPVMPPLLNRFEEMHFYQKWITQEKDRNRSGLLIIGESRTGKTSLAEWMAHYARSMGISVCFLSLSCIHSATPYLALSQVIDDILGIKEPVNSFEREEKIVESLKYYSKDLCYLNKILKVRFAFSDDAKDYNNIQKDNLAKQIFIKLIASINKTQVIVLDDLQNLDADSWEYISLMADQSKTFVVLTVTRGKSSSVHSWLFKVFADKNIKKMLLGPLASQWIPALACQILDVIAVPIELCEAIKSKYKGMPGLIESYLINLFLSGVLEVVRVKKSDMDSYHNNVKFVFPDQKLLQPQALNIDLQNRLNELIENDATEENSICVLTDRDKLDSFTNTQNQDIQIMIQIDSLTPYQQLLLKIASVVGNVITRDLLESIMYENNPLTTAKAIKRLFAMQILVCANTRSIKKIRYSLKKSDNTKNINCDCNFNYNPEECNNLPKYAYCKIMKFRKRNYKQLYYDLLPVNQKKEFHTRIINYLENNEPKCFSCGGVYMRFGSTDSAVLNRQGYYSESSMVTSMDINNTYDEKSKISSSSHEGTIFNDLQKPDTEKGLTSKSDTISATPKETSNKPTHSENILRSSMKTSKILNSNIPLRINKRVTLTDGLLSDNDNNNVSPNDEEQNTIMFENIRSILELGDIYRCQLQNTNNSEENSDSETKSFTIPLEKNLSQVMYEFCNCAELTISIYEQLIYHALMADLKSKCIEFMIKFSDLNLLNNNVNEALEKLEDAEKKCLENTDIDKLDIKKYLAKIYTLRANAFIQIGNLTMAKVSIERAANIYNVNFYKITEFFKVRHLISAVKLDINKGHSYKNAMKVDSVCCLNVASKLFQTLNDFGTAKITTSQLMHIVQRVACDTVDLCEAYSNAIQIELDRGYPELTEQLEKLASNALKNLSRPVKVNELIAVGKLYLATFRSRQSRAQIDAAIRSGIRSLTVSKFLQAQTISLEIIPDLVYCLLAAERISDAISVIRETPALGYFPNVVPEMWYYALCIDLILDTGYEVESPNEISRFADYSIGRGGSESQSMYEAARKRLVIGLWTYWQRADNELKAKHYEHEALGFSASQNDELFMSTLLTSLRLCEGMIECLSRKIGDLRKVVDIMELKSVADRNLTRLENDARFCKILLPRWLILKGYALTLSSRSSANTFAQALEEARKMHNKMEECIIIAATRSSTDYWRLCTLTRKFRKWNAAEHKSETWHTLMYNMKITTPSKSGPGTRTHSTI